jgi:hypothetical protein
LAAFGGVSEEGYLAPPRATAAQVRDGVLRVEGEAPPRSKVELVSPEGDLLHAVADGRGLWRARLPGTSPRLYAISATAPGGRTVHAEGALVSAPGALAPAVMVRAGDAARPLLRSTIVELATVDYDPSGVLAVAGSAPPHAALALLVDDAPAAVGQADAGGRYALLSANHRVAFGPHRLAIRSPAGLSMREVVLQPPEALTSPYRALPAPGGGWRVEWALTGGGEQTTLILPP